MDHTTTHRKTQNLACKLPSVVPKAASQGAEQQNQRLPSAFGKLQLWSLITGIQILGEAVAMTPCCAAGSGVSISGKWPKSDHIKKIFAFLLCGGQILFPLEVVQRGTNTTFHPAPAE